METIQLPNRPVIVETGPSTYTLSFEPLYPGYGVTVGNALRRVLLSSLPGAAVTAVKIKFADHEFSTIPHVKEDVVQIILNIKKLVLKSFSTEPVRLKLHVKRVGAVTAGDIEETDQVQVINKDLHIATLDSASGELDMEFVVEQGRGYVPVEARENAKYELGVLAVDAIYTPVRAAHFEITNVRVGQMTNFEKLLMTVETNGTLTGEEAFDLASRIIIDHLRLLVSGPLADDAFTDDTEAEAISEDTSDAGEMTEMTVAQTATNDAGTSLETLTLSTRARNSLQKAGVSTVEALQKLTNDDIRNLSGMGEKTVTEIMMVLGRE